MPVRMTTAGYMIVRHIAVNTGLTLMLKVMDCRSRKKLMLPRLASGLLRRANGTADVTFSPSEGSAL